jgi:hypothetical protein
MSEVPHQGFPYPKSHTSRLEPRLKEIKNTYTVASSTTVTGFIGNLTALEADQALFILEGEHRMYAGKEAEAKRKAGILRAFTTLEDDEDWRTVKDKEAEKEAEAWWRHRAKVFGAWHQEWEQKIQDMRLYLVQMRRMGGL